MPLDPQAQQYLAQAQAQPSPPLSALTPQAARAAYRAARTSLGGGASVAHVVDRRIPGPAGEIPIRVYTPPTPEGAAGGTLFPVVVYFHGGGWVIGDLDTHDHICRDLASGAGAVVVAVDYRLAPEHPFPAAPDDAYAATTWVAGHATEVGADAARLAVVGDSAGGNLAAVVAQMARERGGPRLALQVLVYPSTDLRISSPSTEEYATGYGLTKDDMVWFTDHYTPNPADRVTPLASPLLAEDLRGLPPALVITAEYDPERDEGEQYGERLTAAAVATSITRYRGTIHSFFALAPILEQGRHAIEEVCRALRAAFGEREVA